MAIKKKSMDDTTLPAFGGGPGVGRGIRVLIADDERDTLMTLGVLLRSEEFDVRMVADGHEVENVMRDFQPHVVVLDLSMPARDGYQVAGALRAAYGETCPIMIALTAHSAAADKVRAHRSGFRHHVTKPYDPVRLIELLAAVGRKS
jgi:CheY-like chemotaxis protein